MSTPAALVDASGATDVLIGKRCSPGPRVRASVSTADDSTEAGSGNRVPDTLGAMTLGGHVGVRDQQVGADFSGSRTVLPGLEHDCRAVLVG